MNETKNDTAGKKQTLRLVLGDQLNPEHSWFQDGRRDALYVMMEIMPEANYVRHHVQKIVAFFAAMRSFASQLRERGYRVMYFELDAPDNRQSFIENLQQVVQSEGAGYLEYQEPDEYRVDQELQQLENQLSVPVRRISSEHFLTERDTVRQFFGEKKSLRMESFYHHMRRELNVLMQDGKPVGGQWNFDEENRQILPGEDRPPGPPLFDHEIGLIYDMIQKLGVECIGRMKTDRFWWPIHRKQALQMLKNFLERRLMHFGRYQDAMSGRSSFLYHSALSFALNTKMLSPMEVVRKAEEYWESHQDDITLPQIEGFVRQIIGWREYVRGVYWGYMPEYKHSNFFGNTLPLPEFYWSGDAQMNCLRHAVTQSLELGYAHHIQRLMVTGNFALLAGVDPAEVDVWYLGIYLDAVEWVELPNTRGMSQFADGGLVATKPYVSSANYINKMSDYCRNCHYDPKQRIGSEACPFNALYWDFYRRHREKLENHPRIGFVY
ncbi:MAG TPA: cryptochrome/photolyase family protein, partial [bacterium]|nr:cryptochrome/photolyase family protein [bacterium]